jgi:hypothetical protein
VSAVTLLFWVAVLLLVVSRWAAFCDIVALCYSLYDRWLVVFVWTGVHQHTYHVSSRIVVMLCVAVLITRTLAKPHISQSASDIVHTFVHLVQFT